MTTIQGAVTLAAAGVGQGSVLVVVGVVSMVACAVLGAVIWGSLRLRKVGTAFRKSGSGIREERFAAEVLRDFRPDSVGHRGPDSTGSAALMTVVPLEDFYASPVTSKPVRSAVPATGSLVSVGAHPELPGVFGESVRDLVEAIRGLAVVVEQAALTGGGSELDRAARSVEAFTTGLGALPLKEILVSAGQAADSTRRD